MTNWFDYSPSKEIEIFKERKDYYELIYAQGEEKYFEVRKNFLTSSNGSKAIAKSIFTNIEEFALNFMSQNIEQNEKNEHMKRGIKFEPVIRKAYETKTLNKVTEASLCVSKYDQRIACSPDGLVNEDGGIEIKCPKKVNEKLLEYIKTGNYSTRYDGSPDFIYEDHYIQIQMNLAILCRDWYDYVVGIVDEIVENNNDDEKENSIKELYIVRIEFNHEYWKNYLYPLINDFFNRIDNFLTMDNETMEEL